MNLENLPFGLPVKGDHEIVKILLKSGSERGAGGAGGGIDVNQCNQDGKTPLWIACWGGKKEAVKILLQNPRVEVNQGDKFGETPLQVACNYGREEIVKMLLRDGRANVNQKNTLGKTALWIACKRGKEAIVKILLAGGRGVETKKRRGFFSELVDPSPAQVAMARRDFHLVHLITRYEENPQQVKMELRKELGNSLTF